MNAAYQDLERRLARLEKIVTELREAVEADAAWSALCETCGQPVREGLRFCPGLSACWKKGVGLL